jgi:hypothetical protein
VITLSVIPLSGFHCTAGAICPIELTKTEQPGQHSHEAEQAKWKAGQGVGVNEWTTLEHNPHDGDKLKS